jgi:hypothetical protein
LAQLRQAHHAAERGRKHGPQASLETLDIGTFQHFIGADHQMRINGLSQTRGFELRQRILDRFKLAIRDNIESLARQPLNRVQLPVFSFHDQDAATGMKE